MRRRQSSRARPSRQKRRSIWPIHAMPILIVELSVLAGRRHSAEEQCGQCPREVVDGVGGQGIGGVGYLRVVRGEVVGEGMWGGGEGGGESCGVREGGVAGCRGCRLKEGSRVE